MVENTSLMEFHAPDQSPLMRAVAVLMMPLMTPRAVSTTILIWFHAPVKMALMVCQTPLRIADMRFQAPAMLAIRGGPTVSQVASTSDHSSDQ